MVEMYRAVEILLGLLQLAAPFVLSIRSRSLRSPATVQACGTEAGRKYVSNVGDRNTLRQLTLPKEPSSDPIARDSRANMRVGFIQGGVGHNLLQEAPQAFAQATDFDTLPLRSLSLIEKARLRMTVGPSCL
jgi:hypothetical protein